MFIKESPFHYDIPPHQVTTFSLMGLFYVVYLMGAYQL